MRNIQERAYKKAAQSIAEYKGRSVLMDGDITRRIIHGARGPDTCNHQHMSACHQGNKPSDRMEIRT